MHWINILIISGLLAIVGSAVLHVARTTRRDQRELSARMKRFNMSSDELRGTKSIYTDRASARDAQLDE